MTDSNAAAVPTRFLAHLDDLLKDGRRKVLGLVGAPGSGKSTLAAALQNAFPKISQVVPMDGFHLANTELQRLGRLARKGAPDTFDGAGYVALLKRLKRQLPNEIVYAPELRREIDEPVANAIPIFPETRLVITEGNYLLLKDKPWSKVSALMDEVWYVDVSDLLRKQRLMHRHEQFGRARQDALEWVEVTDEPNARLVESTRHCATREFLWSSD
jgi:pantothenate kinase